MSESVLAWHFVGDTLRDGRPVPADGIWLVHAGPIKMCVSGLHASRDPFDVLKYAPGAILCHVECADIVSSDSDKLVCLRRRIVSRCDATEGLRYFARMQALSVVDHWDAPDVVLDWLMTGNVAAKSAAWSAAWSAAESAAKSEWTTLVHEAFGL